MKEGFHSQADWMTNVGKNVQQAIIEGLTLTPADSSKVGGKTFEASIRGGTSLGLMKHFYYTTNRLRKNRA